MTTLAIHDLPLSTELDRAAMASVHGGQGLFELFNLVTDVDLAQAFGISNTVSNFSFIEATQANENVNGLQFAPQFIFVTQSGEAPIENVGNTGVNGGGGAI